MSSAWLPPPPHKSSLTWWSVSWTSFKLICLSVFMQISAPWEENGTQFCCIQHYVTVWKNQRISFVQTNNIETYSRLTCIMNYEKKTIYWIIYCKGVIYITEQSASQYFSSQKDQHCEEKYSTHYYYYSSYIMTIWQQYFFLNL